MRHADTRESVLLRGTIEQARRSTVLGQALVASKIVKTWNTNNEMVESLPIDVSFSDVICPRWRLKEISRLYI